MLKWSLMYIGAWAWIGFFMWLLTPSKRRD